MHISFSSLLMSLLFGNIFIGIMMFIIKKNKLISKFNINFITSCLLLILIRLALPVELSFTKTVACEILLPNVQQFLYLSLGRSNITFMSILLLVWGSVTCLKLITFLISYIKSRKLIGTLIGNVKKCQDNVINEILEAICEKKDCSKKFTVIKIEACQSPFIFGLIHPVIILPQIELNYKELEFILAHETEHYFHHDLWKKYLTEIVCIMYWWNPFVYFLKKELDNILELRSDSFITEKLDERKKMEYLECLLKIAKINKGHENRKQSLAFCGGATANNLEQRFDFILNRRESGKKYNKYLCLLISGMIILMSFSFIFESYWINPQVESTTFTLSPENAYILIKDDQYYICVDGMPTMQINGMKEAYADLPIYKEEKKSEKD